MTARADSPARPATAEGSSGAATGAAAPPMSRQGGAPALGEGGSATRSVARLGMMIGNQRLLVDLAEAGEIVALPPVIVPVPLTKDWFLGVTNLRGSLFTVVDLRRFAGDGVTEIGKETRLLSLAPSLGFNVTLVVSRMLGLRNTASMTAVVNATPSHLGAGWLGNSFADADGHIWRELSMSRLIATPDFLMIGS
jgi:twitching motility protein PilI